MSKDGSDPFTSAEFRAACATFPTGVTVVTRLMADRKPHGITVSSFTSLSLHPPLLLVCIDLRASFLRGLVEGEAFAINVLNETQQDLSVRFSKPHEQGRFHHLLWREGERGVPLLSDALATFECELTRTVDAGDHRILIGRVRRLNHHKGRPLLWHRASYHSIASSG